MSTLVKRSARARNKSSRARCKVWEARVAAMPAESDTDTDTSSSESESEPDRAPAKNALYRSYLKFTVSQDPENQSFLSRIEFAQLDLYQIEALRDDEDPLGLSKEMQGASRHFPCHVFWSKELASGKYAVWGRPTVGLHEQEAVIRMLQAQRQERQEYISLLNQRKWQEECERRMREQELALSARRAEARASARRASEAPAPDPAIAGRVASIVHRIHRSEGDAPLTPRQAAGRINRGLKRLGMEALAAGTFALVSAVAYLSSLQQEDAQSGLPSLLGRLGILPEPPHLAARAGGGGAASTSVTDRVFAAHARRHN